MNGFAAYAQIADSLLTGKWNEVFTKKKKSYYIPLHIEFKFNGTAEYTNLYPERSYNLTWSVNADSTLMLSDGTKYKIAYAVSSRLKLINTKNHKKRIIVLRKVKK